MKIVQDFIEANTIEIHGDVSVETKRTARNLLLAAATSMFAVFTGSKLQDIPIIKGVITHNAYVEIALCLILGSLILSHILNLRTDLMRDMDKRVKRIEENQFKEQFEEHHIEIRMDLEAYQHDVEAEAIRNNVSLNAPLTHFSNLYSFYYRMFVVSVGAIAFLSVLGSLISQSNT